LPYLRKAEAKGPASPRPLQSGLSTEFKFMFDLPKPQKSGISGGKGSWGNPVMDPHPNLQESDAKAMVSYILFFGVIL